MALTIEVGYFNTFALKRLASTANPQIADPNEDWYIEESRIKGGYNNTSTDFGVKAYLVDDEPFQQRRSNSLIYSGVINSRTGVNNTNQFSIAEEITRSVDPINGSIQKLYSEDTNLIIFQEKKVNRALIDKDAIYSAEGSSITTTANLVIGQIIAYAGNFGISQNPESFAVYGYRKYFTDKNRNAVLRLSNDGITEVSNYGMIDFFRDQLSAVVDPLVTQNIGGTIKGGYDIFNHAYSLSIQYNNGVAVPDFGIYKTLNFDEAANGWTSLLTYRPFFSTSLQGKFYTFNDTAFWQHYDLANNQYNSFYSEAIQPSSLTYVVNPEPLKHKNFNTLNYQGSNGWEVVSFTTDATGEDQNPTGLLWENFSDTVSTVWSYDQGQYTEGGAVLYAGFARKNNLYTAALKGVENTTQPALGEVLTLNTQSGVKGYTATIKMQTDTTRTITANGQTQDLTATAQYGLKELFSVGVTYN